MESRKNKRYTLIFMVIVTLTFVSQQQLMAQKVVLQTDEVQGENHISKDDFPKGNIINMVHGWGGMTVSINEFKGGTDFTPILEGLKDDLCQVPHWGYLEKGKIRVIDSNNTTKTIVAGEVYYMPPGHTLIVDEDARTIEFSPEKQMKELNTFVENKIAQMQKEK